jgi:hypothetical protein
MLGVSIKSALKPNPGDPEGWFNDDLKFSLDLGIVKIMCGLRPANPIYATAIVRFYNQILQLDLPNELAGKWLDGKNLDMTGLLKDFQQFWALNSEKYLSRMNNVELGPHLLLSAFIQKVVLSGSASGGASRGASGGASGSARGSDGSGQVINHFINGWGFADIIVQYAGRSYVVELTMKENLRSQAQTINLFFSYMYDTPSKESWLVVFDRKSKKSWPKKLTWVTKEMENGQDIYIVGC